MQKTRVFSFICFFILFFTVISLTPGFSQSYTAPTTRYKKYPFTLTWVALDYAGWYVVEIQTIDGKPVESVKTTEPYYVFNAYPGQYMLKIYVYNKLGTLEAVSDWRVFTVTLPKREQEEKKEEKEKIERNYLIMTNLEGISSLGPLLLDQNYAWGFSSMLGIAFTDFSYKDKSYGGLTVGTHIYFSGNIGTDDSYIDFIGTPSVTWFLGYRLIANGSFSCLPFAEVGLAFPFMLENKDKGLETNHASGAVVCGFGSTFMLHFNKFFLSTTFAYALNIYFAEGEGKDATDFQFNNINPTVESGFSFTLGCGFLF